MASPALALGQQAEQGLAGDLGRGVPDRHVESAHRHRTLAVAAGLLVLHHRGPDLVRIKVIAALVEQALGSGLQDAVAEALADQATLAVAAVRVEAVADDATPVANHVGHHGNQARGHLREVDIGVADRRCDRLGDFADVDDAHGNSLDVMLLARVTRDLAFSGNAIPLDAAVWPMPRSVRRHASSASVMDLDWLKDFLALAEQRNFSRAAEVRNVTQPAFSRRIRALEDWIGTPLFVRGAQGASLTPAGIHFQPLAEDLLRSLQRVAPRDQNRGRAGDGAPSPSRQRMRSPSPSFPAGSAGTCASRRSAPST